MTTTIIIIEKSGAIKERTVKTISEETIFKSAGFKTATDFKCHTTWNLEVANVSYSIELYGKTTGRAGQENKYELPPPLDNTLFFGNCVIINRCKTTQGFLNLKESEWTAIYNTLYGGFEDIEMSEDDDDDDEYDSDDELPKTKNGYTKDGFVVDDDAEEDIEDEDAEDDDEDDSEDDESEEDTPPKSAKKKANKSRLALSNAKKMVVIESPAQTAESIFLDCTTELAEEEYDE
jgi:hypothetical protein